MVPPSSSPRTRPLRAPVEGHSRPGTYHLLRLAADSVTRAQYWHLYLRATISNRHGVAVSCGSHAAVLGMVTSGRFGYDSEGECWDGNQGPSWLGMTSCAGLSVADDNTTRTATW
jgi:hypothetical protein